MTALRLQIYFTGSKIITVIDTLDGVIQMLFTNETLKKYEPLKIVYPGSTKVLYFDRNKFWAYYQGELTYEELIRTTLCDQLYRNWLEIELRPGVVIEPGALWMLKGNHLHLIDDDTAEITELDKESFEIAN